ncbi:hypothetical protein FHL15_010155 [Xylaria flabelliformis]|uniref:Nephrocystin 3-like N-terminal domain-containing protein n=1 Tax=Xylaria flabelliformis TaxID=2512241 RepID=A0A553HLY1_9PEZI|nr:hypothetical protein FHL15_010155 [Xylaria flabelliformis]
MFRLLRSPSGLSEMSSRSEEESPSAGSSLIALSSRYGRRNPGFSSTNTPSSQEYTALDSQSSGSGSNSLAMRRMRSMITEAYGRIQGQAKLLMENLKEFEKPRIRNLLIPPLNECLRVGQTLEDLLEQDRSNHGELRIAVYMLTSYVEGLKKVTGRISPLLQSDLTAIITGRSGTSELERVANILVGTLQETSPVIESLTLLIQVEASREQLLHELQRTKEKLVIAELKLSTPDESDQNRLVQPIHHGARIKDISSSNSQTCADRSRGKPSQSNVNIKRLESLAYLPYRPYQDVPEAYIRRHDNIRKYVAMEPNNWFIYSEKFREWVNNENLAFFSCEGPHAVGKSVIATRVIDWLQHTGLQHAYFYFGSGKVQTAAGVALSLLAQLCANSGYIPPFLDLLRPGKRPKTTREASDEGKIVPRRRQPSLFTKRIIHDSILTSSSLVPLVPVVTDAEITERGERPESSLLASLSHTPIQSPLDGPKTPDSGGDTRAQPPIPVVTGIKRVETGESDNDLDYNQNRPSQEATKGDEHLKSTKKFGKADTRSVPGLGVLIRAMHMVRLRFEGQVFIVLDGWDEDNMINPEDFITLLRALKADGCKIFMTTRWIDHLSNETEYSRMSLRGIAPPQYIEPYVRGLLPAIPEGSSLATVYDHLTKEIADMSNGVFDVAKVIARQFSPRQPETVSYTSDIMRMRDVVRNGDIMSYGFQTTVSSDKEKATDLLISWILVSPVPLTSASLREVFSNVYRHWKDSTKREVPHQDQKYPYIDTILERCEPFVAVDPGNDCVYFTSANVKTIAAQTISNTIQRQLAVAVVRTSLNYLDCAEDFTKGCCETEEELTELLRKHPFLHQSAYLGNYLALIRDEDFQGNEDIHEKIERLINSQKRLLIMQVFYYTRDEYGEEKSPSWDKFIRSINLMSILDVAALWGQLKLVEKFLKEDEQFATRTNGNASQPLHEAAKSGVVEVVKALLRANPSMAHAVDDMGRTPLFYAWRGGHGEAVIVLFQARCANQTLQELGDIEGKDIDLALQQYCLAKSGFVDGDDETRCMGVAMVRAIKDNFDVIAELLIKKGAKVNEVDDGTTALYTAVQQGKDNLVDVLILAGANPKVGVPDGKEPVLHAAVRKRLGWPTLRLLLSHSQNLDINCKDSRGRTALFSAMEVEDQHWVMETMDLLLWYGLNVDLLDHDDNHIMHIAAEKGYTEVFSEITFRSRLAEEPKNKAGKTPFDIAQEFKYEEIMTFIRPTYRLTS